MDICTLNAAPGSVLAGLCAAGAPAVHFLGCPLPAEEPEQDSEQERPCYPSP